jgi:tetratricopeptide (TPR) repeat protein
MTSPTTFEYDVFISYNQNDEAWAKQLATRLEREDWQGRKLKVFFAPWDIKPGESIPERLEYALPRSRKVCLIMSPESATSEWVKIERYVTQHIDITERQSRLIPLYRRESEIPPFLQHINRIDFQDDAKFEEAYRLLLATIKDEPLPRGEKESSGAVIAPAPIPRPPIVGFVARRDSDGRDIVKRLKTELAPQENQLIVLSGPGGVGKTTLASETARAFAQEHDRRIVWVGADGREDFGFATLLDEIATQLGRVDLRPLPLESKEEQVRSVIAAATPLIVLDNFETVAAAEQIRCVEFLLKRAPCPVLVTTRPRIAAARNIVIPVMSPDEANDFLQRLIDQAGDPSSFASLDRERIMTASDRTPLLMQWVVAQIDLAQEADTVLAELVGGVGDAAQRVFERSFGSDLLGDDGRAVLLALSLFTPDASRNALAATAGFGEDVKRLNEAVKRLASLWLVKTSARQRLTVEGLTRELAKAHLERDKSADEYRRRFVNYFLTYTRAHASPTPEHYEALEVDRENIISAVDAAMELKDWESVKAIAFALGLPVGGMLRVHGYWNETIKMNEQAVRAALESNSENEVAAFKHNLAVMHKNRGELELARRLYKESLEIEQKLGNQGGIAISLHELARLAQGQGELKDARRLYHESLKIKKRLGDQGGIAIALHQLAMLSHDQGELEDARRLYHESLEIKKRLGNQNGISSTLHQLAILAQDQGELVEARRLYNESLEIKERLGNQGGIATSLHELARLAQGQGELEEARRLYNESLEIEKRLGNQAGIASTLHQLATLARNQGELEQAWQLSKESLEIEKRLGSQYGIAISLHQIATLAQDQGELEEARRLYNESLEIKKRLGNQRGIAITLHQLGRLAEEEDKKTEAAKLFAEALAILEQLKSPDAEIARRSLERVSPKSA